jgi:[protein-PII] uridylyltransferase
MSDTSDEPQLIIELPQLPGFAPDAAWGTEAREYLDEARERLFVEHQNGASGTSVVATYTEAMDRMLRSLFAASSELYSERFSRLEQRCALVAQGGYGRGELNPWSDIDLLFLCERSRGAFLESVAERLMYTLYDTRIQVGNAMRTSRECVKLAATDLKVKTALLDARFLCGDRELYDEFAAMMESEVLKRGAERFYKEKMEENVERHARYGDSVYLLEPEIKEGEGGLRDLHTAMWMAKVRFKTNKLDELVLKGVITERERDEIEAARDFLWRVRNALHFITRKHQDQLRFEYQDQLAQTLGFGDGVKGLESFMRAYYLAAASVNHFGEQIVDRCTPEPTPVGRWFGNLRRREIRPGVTITSGVITVSGVDLLESDPTNFLQLFADARNHKVELSSGTRRLLRQHLDLIDDAQRQSPAMAKAFLDVLRLRHGVYEALLDMHRVGVLGAYLPEFGNLLCMVVRDLSHIYTVDQHTLRTIFELERLRNGGYKEMVPLLTSVVREVERLDLVYLSLLLHDIGKGHGSHHSERGAKRVPEIAARLNLNEDEAEQVHFLVAAHLEMSGLARSRDIHDERIVVEFAKRVGSADNLKALYVLTFADMRGVAPKVWNNWHDMLLGELYRRTLDVFERGVFDVEAHTARVRRVQQRVLSRVHPDDVERARAFVADMPDRYFLGTAEESIVEHIELASRLEHRGVVTEIQHVPELEYTEFTVVTADRPGLFAKLSGVLLVHGMDVLGASINTGLSGRVVDIFRIAHEGDPEVAQRPERWNRMRDALERVLLQGEDVEEMVANARLRPVRRWRPQVPTEILVDNEVSDHFTILDVNSQDRVGALYAIANVLYHLGLSIYLAKITTNVDHILDVFYVTDEAGRKVTDPERIEAIRAAIFAGLHELAEREKATGT